MNRRASLIALVAPVLLTLVLLVAMSLSTLLEVVFLMTIALPLVVVVVLASLGLAAVYFLGLRRGDDRATVRLAGSLALGLILSVALAVPGAVAAGWALREIRGPARALLAERMIQRAQARGSTGRSPVQLTGWDALLSDGASAEVDLDGRAASVLFWDSQGILEGSASVYDQDPQASSLPGDLGDEFDAQHTGGHWWMASSD
jgi:nitrogen fixation/metabolism regulation signal transduction histidine kinase